MKNFKDIMCYQKDSPKKIFESVYPDNVHTSTEMPNVLILQRKSIRQIAAGVKVALYYAPKINKYISIPYDNIKEDVIVSTINENIIDKLVDIKASGEKRIIFEDGSSENVNVKDARAILIAYDKLDENNKNKISEMAQKNKKNFKAIVEFAWKNI